MIAAVQARFVKIQFCTLSTRDFGGDGDDILWGALLGLMEDGIHD